MAVQCGQWGMSTRKFDENHGFWLVMAPRSIIPWLPRLTCHSRKSPWAFDVRDGDGSHHKIPKLGHVNKPDAPDQELRTTWVLCKASRRHMRAPHTRTTCRHMPRLSSAPGR